MKDLIFDGRTKIKGRRGRSSASMDLEAFYRVLPLVKKRVGAFFFLLAILLAVVNYFPQLEERPLAAAKRINSDGLLYSPKTCVKRPCMLAFI